LNEENGFAIVARKIAITHPLLKGQDNRSPRINWDSATVASKSTVLTTLQALQDMAECYLASKFPHWQPQKPGLIPMRPEDEELREGIEEFGQLFDCLATLPSYQRIESGEQTDELRRFSFEKPGGEGNILFRPVGQIALANALGILVFKKQLSLTSIFDKLRRYDVDEGFSHMDNPESVWYGILYDPDKKRMLVSGKELAAKLIVYLVGGTQDDTERELLRQAVAAARAIEGKAMSFSGKFVHPQELKLPSVLS
jgi:hypothetical protein